MQSFLGVIHITQLANIGPCDVPRSSPSNVPWTLPKDPIWPSRGRQIRYVLEEVPIWLRGEVLKWHPGDVLIWRSRDVPGRLIREALRTLSEQFFLTFFSELIWLTKSIWKYFNTQGVLRTLWNLQDGVFSEKLVNALLAVNYFRDRTSS